MPNKKIKEKTNFFSSFKLVLKYYKYYIWPLVGIFILSILSSTISIGSIILMQFSFEYYGIDFKQVCIICGSIIGVYVVDWVILLFQYRLCVIIGQKIAMRLRNDLFKKLNTLSIFFYDTNKTGDIMSKFTNDINNISSLISDNFADIIGAVIWCCGLTIGMLIISPTLSLIVFVFFAIIITFIAFFIKRSNKYFNLNQQSLSNMSTFLQEKILGQPIIDIYNQQDSIFNEFKMINKELAQNTYKSQFYSGISIPLISGIINVATVTITVISMIIIINGNINVFAGIPVAIKPSGMKDGYAVLLVFNILSRQFFSPLMQVSNVMNIVMGAKAGIGRLVPIFNQTSEFNALETQIVEIAYLFNKNKIDNILNKNIKVINYINYCSEFAINNDYDLTIINYSYINTYINNIEQTNNNILRLEPIVEFKNVDFGYNENELILKDINLKINKGDFIGIVGPTGSGKTTLINLISKFYEINNGEILIDNHSIQTMDKNSLRKNISMVLQDNFLFEISIKDNLKIVNPDATDEEIINVTKITECYDIIMKLPNGFDTIIHSDSSMLSKGERQLIAIARALLANNDLLILDEATSSIDTKTEKIIQNAMMKLIKNKTSIMIAHRLSTIRDATKIVVIKNGKIIEIGNHDELIQLNGFYASLYNSQLNIIE